MPTTPTEHEPLPQAPRAWTAERIRALGPVTTVPVVAAIFGLSRSVAYDLARTGQLPVPILRFGTRYRIPVAAILAALHMPVDPQQLDRAAQASVDRAQPTRGRPTTGHTPPQP